MPIRVECPSCGKRFKAPDRLAGKKARCNQCKNVVSIPEAAAESEEDFNVEPQEFQMDEAPERGTDLRAESAAPRKEAKRGLPKLPLVIGGVAVVVVVAVVLALLFLRKKPAPASAPGPPPTVQVDPFDYAVPANADTVFDVNFAALRGAPLWTTIANALGGEEAPAGKSPLESLIRAGAADADELAKIEKSIGVVNKIERVYGGAVSGSKQALFVISASSDADWDGLLALARESAGEEGAAIEETKIGDYTAYHSSNVPGAGEEDMWVVRYSDRIAIAGTETLVRAAVDAMGAGTPPSAPGELMSLFGAAGKATIVAASTKDPQAGGMGAGMGFSMGAPAGGPAGDARSSFKGTTMSFDLSQGVGVACKIRFGKPEDAMKTKAQMDMAIGMLSMMVGQKPELLEAIQSLKANIEGGNITIDINFTNEQIVAAIEAVKEMKESMGGWAAK